MNWPTLNWGQSHIARSPVGLGTAPLGSIETGPLWWGPQDEDEAISTVRAAVEAGVGWIDTAPFYGWGRAEEIVGRALTAADDVRLLTKCGTVQGPDGRAIEDASPESIRRGVASSLRRLGVDRLDVVQIHDEDPRVPIEESWSALMQLVDERVIGGAGLSNHSPELMDRALAVGPVAVVQHQYSLLWRRPERDGVLRWCAAHGVPFLAWSPLASGFLAGGFDVATLDGRDLRRRLRWSAGADAERVSAARAVLDSVAKARGASITAVAVAWITQRGHGGSIGGAIGAIVGARRAAEIAELASLPQLTGDDMDRLDAVATEA